MLREDPRLADAKSMDIERVLGLLRVEGLRRSGPELTGPCPRCGGTDRFAVNIRTHKFLCRQCGMAGGDTVGLVQEVLGMGFIDALGWLCGPRPELSDEELRRREAERRKAREKQDREAEYYRRRAIERARAIWHRARPGHLGVVAAYLRARGIEPERLPGGLPQPLHFVVAHPYLKTLGKGGDRRTVTLWTGPAMIAPIQQPNGEVTAVHQTWVDPAPPHGKARIVFEGEEYPAKTVQGAKKGGAIRLIDPPRATTLVMAEGIENTLTAALAWAGDLPGAAYWCGVDLGNLAGIMIRRDGVKHSGEPDMSDAEAFVPPPWIKRLILVKDGDSAPRMTHAKLQSCARRALAHNPALSAEIVPAPAGADLNDVLLGRGPEADAPENPENPGDSG